MCLLYQINIVLLLFKKYKIMIIAMKIFILVLPSEKLASFIQRLNCSIKYEGKWRENISEDFKIGA